MISSVTPETDYDPLGEMWGWRRIPIEHGFWVCLDVDEPGPFEYKIVRSVMFLNQPVCKVTRMTKAVLTLILQSAANLMIQQVLGEPERLEIMTSRDLAALSPLITQHINPYGRFELDMETRLPLAA